MNNSPGQMYIINKFRTPVDAKHLIVCQKLEARKTNIRLDGHSGAIASKRTLSIILRSADERCQL